LKDWSAPLSQARAHGGSAVAWLGVVALALLLTQYARITSDVTQGAAGLARFIVRPDFIIDLTGATILLDGRAALLYDEPTQQTTQTALLQAAQFPAPRLLPFNHPPFEALLIAGLRRTGLSFSEVWALWTVLRLGAIGAGLLALRWAWPARGAGGALRTLGALTFYPLFTGVLVGQVTPIIFLSWAAGSAALRRGYNGWAGAAFALTICKPQYASVVLLALLAQGRGRALLTFGGVAGGAYALSAPFAGADWPARYAGLVLDLAGRPPNDAIDPAMMQNWRGLFQRWLAGSDATLPVTLLAVGLSLVALVAMWRRIAPEDGAAIDGAVWDCAWACTLLVGLLTSFHLLYPDLTLAIAPAWIVAAGAAQARGALPRLWLWLGWALGFVVNFQSLVLTAAPLWMAATAGALGWAAWRRAPPRRRPLIEYGAPDAAA
jgi:hypothetical protein